jgi:hypothetical protein
MILPRNDEAPYKAGAAFYCMLVAATVVTTIVHETAHWAMGIALGHDMAMSFNEAHAVAENDIAASHAMLIAAAGPAITILQALVAYVLVRSRGLLLAYPFLFAAWFMRFAAAFVSLSHPNDEARLSIDLLGGMWWLPAGAVSVLFGLVWLSARRLRLGWKTNLACYLICSAMTAAIVFGDRLL